MTLKSQFTLRLPHDWEQQLPSQKLKTDHQKMTFVVELAGWNSSQKKGGPFAAAVFDEATDDLISIGVNRVVPDGCTLAHAEAMAIALAQQQLNTFQLAKFPKLALFTSGQPCVQCFGMLWWSGISRLVTAASADDIQELASFDEGPLVENWQQTLADRSPLNSVMVTEGVARDAARQVLKQYGESGGINYGPLSENDRT
ncbi:MAG: nucleoside deaminase [Fuerstiella sp.]